MSDNIQTQLNDLTIAVGQMITGIDDIKKLQSDVVELLRAHDRTDSRVDSLATIVEKHENELTEIRKERIATAAKREHLNYWLGNWRNVVTVMVTILAAGVVLYPQALSLAKNIPVS